MKRGELYWVRSVRGDPRGARVELVVGRQTHIDSRFSMVACVPVYSNCPGLNTQVLVDENVGLKHLSCLSCDSVMSIPKASLTHFVGALPATRMREAGHALTIALGLEDDIEPGPWE